MGYGSGTRIVSCRYCCRTMLLLLPLPACAGGEQIIPGSRYPTRGFHSAKGTLDHHTTAVMTAHTTAGLSTSASRSFTETLRLRLLYRHTGSPHVPSSTTQAARERVLWLCSFRRLRVATGGLGSRTHSARFAKESQAEQTNGFGDRLCTPTSKRTARKCVRRSSSSHLEEGVGREPQRRWGGRVIRHPPSTAQ